MKVKKKILENGDWIFTYTISKEEVDYMEGSSELVDELAPIQMLGVISKWYQRKKMQDNATGAYPSSKQKELK